MIDRYIICASGYGEAYEVPAKEGAFVLYDDMHEYIVKLKLEFEERLANGVNAGYDEGWKDGYIAGLEL